MPNQCLRGGSFFALVQASSPHLSHTLVFVKMQKKLRPDKQVHQLQQLTDTRWTCRQGAVHAICCTFDAILGTLEEIEDDNDRAKAMEARGLLLQVKRFKFVLSLVVFDRLLSCSKGLSDVLQSTQLELAKAADLVSALIETFEDFRSDESWKKVFEYAVSVSQHRTIEAEVQKKRQSRQPRRLDDTIVDTSLGHREAPPINCSEHFKVTLYFAVLDAFLSVLKKRFDSKNLQIMKSVQACSPQSTSFLQSDDLSGLTEAYGMADLHYRIT